MKSALILILTPCCMTPAWLHASAPTDQANIDAIRTAYHNQKTKEDHKATLALITAYLKKHPKDLEVLKMAYKSYFYVGDYQGSLQVIYQIEAIEKKNFNSQIACDGRAIGHFIKNKRAESHFAPICEKKNLPPQTQNTPKKATKKAKAPKKSKTNPKTSTKKPSQSDGQDIRLENLFWPNAIK